MIRMDLTSYSLGANRAECNGVTSTFRYRVAAYDGLSKRCPRSFKPAPTDPLFDEASVAHARTRRSEK